MIDIAQIKIKGGDGGDGKVSFRREKYIPKGGPDGGDGGKGGSVSFLADQNMATLIDFRSKPNYSAQDGEPGGKKKMSGGDGEDLVIKVPVGTIVYEIREGQETVVADLTEHSKNIILARGGKGGKGNFRFRSSTNQTPYQYTPGVKGEEKLIKLEIKLVADVGLVGLPNAGKSTLLNSMTHANAKVADYPFTTLSPNLGVYRLRNGKDIVISDIPGLIEGASGGKGLGDEFLRHIERTRIVVHIIDPVGSLGEVKEEDSDLAQKVINDYRVIRDELEAYGNGLSEKLEILVINKIDITEVKENFSKIKKAFSKIKIEPLGISAVTGEGIEELGLQIMNTIDKLPEKKVYEEVTHTKLFKPDNLPNKKIIFDIETVLEKER